MRQFNETAHKGNEWVLDYFNEIRGEKKKKKLIVNNRKDFVRLLVQAKKLSYNYMCQVNNFSHDETLRRFHKLYESKQSYALFLFFFF